MEAFSVIIDNGVMILSTHEIKVTLLLELVPGIAALEAEMFKKKEDLGLIPHATLPPLSLAATTGNINKNNSGSAKGSTENVTKNIQENSSAPYFKLNSTFALNYEELHSVNFILQLNSGRHRKILDLIEKTYAQPIRALGELIRHGVRPEERKILYVETPTRRFRSNNFSHSLAEIKKYVSQCYPAIAIRDLYE